MARVLLLGGLDPSGGAGITVDATVVSLLGGEPLPVALATTIQGLRGFVRSQPIDPGVIREQVRTVLADGPVHAIKVGYVGSAEQIAMVAEMLELLHGQAKLVVDPVLSATAGGMSCTAELVAAYREQLIPFAQLLTPNTPELAALADGRAASLLELGAQAVLHKGGHGSGPEAVDELWQQDAVAAEVSGQVQSHGAGRPSSRFSRLRFECGPVRGTGCALASAIATHLAGGLSVADACRTAGDWLSGMLSRVEPRSDGLPSVLPLGQS